MATEKGPKLEWIRGEYCYNCSHRAYILKIDGQQYKICDCGIGVKIEARDEKVTLRGSKKGEG